ncbi:MAG: hypothetical protein DRN07_00925 [Thermoplasmata archaeon]|nr:MAG: hypothetical protein DRN07_00925 [Thermoplasmata archaeon]
MIELLIALFALWIIVLYIAKKKGKDRGLDVMGPLLMWKTEKGKKTIEYIAKRRAWKRYGDISIILCIVAMVFTTALIIFNVIVSFQIPPQNAPSPRLIIGLPGINPVIPVGYGILALLVAIVVHEFSHGILARAGGIKINTLGLLFLIVPIGAFVEPDEDELKSTSRLKRSRVFAAGPSTNIILAFVCLLILAFAMAPAITSAADGVVMGTDAYGIDKWSVISKIDDTPVHTREDMLNITATLQAGTFHNVTFLYHGTVKETRFFYGLYVENVVKGMPAERVLEEDDIIYKAVYRSNTSFLETNDDFIAFMNATHAGDELTLYYYRNGTFSNASLVLADKYEYTDNEKDAGKGFLGIGAYGISDMVMDTDFIPNIYHPFRGRFLQYLTLPFIGMSPLPAELESIYTPSHAFWILYNILYWIFWLNFAVGTFNALPAIPLDGGYIFHDGINYMLSKRGRKKEKTEKLSSMVSTALSILVLLSLVSIILVPRLRGFISF